MSAMPTPVEIQAKVLRRLKAGAKPLELARKFGLSLLALAEIADSKSKSAMAKRPPPPMR